MRERKGGMSWTCQVASRLRFDPCMLHIACPVLEMACVDEALKDRGIPRLLGFLDRTHRGIADPAAGDGRVGAGGQEHADTIKGFFGGGCGLPARDPIPRQPLRMVTVIKCNVISAVPTDTRNLAGVQLVYMWGVGVHPATVLIRYSTRSRRGAGVGRPMMSARNPASNSFHATVTSVDRAPSTSSARGIL